MTVDEVIGWRIKERRHLLGLSQQALGAKLGMSFQQVQKYEKGTNRVPSSTLSNIANALGASILYFFDGADINVFPEETTKETFELVKRYTKLTKPQQKAVISIINAVYNSNNPSV